jgi:hypothetical protein
MSQNSINEKKLKEAGSIKISINSVKQRTMADLKNDLAV